MKNVLIISLVLAAIACLAWIPSNKAISSQLDKGLAIKASFNLDGEAAITWNKTSHDFGKIVQNEPVDYEFEITNTGSEAVKILEVKTSCGCTAAGYSKEPLEPGESTELTANYNAKKAGVFSKTISVYTDVQEEPFLLKIKGEVTAAE